jgi:hypothetical protein
LEKIKHGFKTLAECGGIRGVDDTSSYRSFHFFGIVTIAEPVFAQMIIVVAASSVKKFTSAQIDVLEYIEEKLFSCNY